VFCPDCGSDLRDRPSPQERKLVTILFADISGSTGLAEQLDPEHFREVIGAFFDAVRTQIESFGGTVEKFIGDAVMAVFGVPIAHEDDPDRALSAAFGMMESLRQLNAQLEKTHGVVLSARVGINTGEVVASAQARPEMGRVAGDAVNVAARLEQSARVGQVLVADRTVRSSRHFRFEDLGAVTLRGRDQPVRIHELLGPTDRLSAPLLRAPMVGREHELTLLRTLLERVIQEQQPHLVTVYGEAGIGKTRLADEFHAAVQAVEPTPIVLGGRCLPYGEESIYQPLAGILKSYAGILDNDPPRLVWEKIEKLEEKVLEEPTGRLAAALGWTVGIEDERFSFRGMSPNLIEAEIQTAWRHFFASLAARAPLVLEIEDLHWADPALLALLEYLADRTAGPVLFVCTARPELADKAPGWGGGQRSFSGIMLDPLTEEQASRLVALLLRVDEMPTSVRSKILHRSDGNPFFIEEILRQLIDEGCIVRAGDRWKAVERITSVQIPDTVQAVVAARLDLLSTAEKRSLQCAAVVGRVFWTGSVASLLEVGEAQVIGLLDQLEHRDLIVARLGSTLDRQQEYSFKHTVIRDVAFDSLSLRERTDLHRRAADWVKNTIGDRRRELVEVLAYHLSQAHAGLRDDPSADQNELEQIRREALTHLLLASEYAKLRIALDSARRLARDGHRLAATAGEEAQALEALGEAYFFGHEGDAAWENLRAAIDLYLEAGHRTSADLARVCARALQSPIRWPGSMQSVPPEADVHRYLEIGYEHAGESDTPERAGLLTLEAFWPHAFPRPQERAHEALVSGERSLTAGEQAVTMARRLGRPDLESAALDGVGANYIALGRYERALEGVNRRLELCAEIDDIWEVGDAHAMGGWINFQLGRYREALSSAERGFGITATRLPSVAIHCLSWRAQARYRLGDWDGVLADLELASEMLGERKDSPPHYISAMHAAAALVHEIRGQSADADRLLEVLRGVDESAEAPDRDSTPLGRWAQFLAPLVARRGWLDDARRMLTGTTWRRGARLGLLLEAECEIAAEGEKWPDVGTLVERARAEAERGGLEALGHAADRLAGICALRDGDTEVAVRLLQRARDGYAELDAQWDLARVDLALGGVLLDSGRVERSHELLRPAIAFFAHVGAAKEHEAGRLLAAAI
jgi:class 3 adenylate cyclase/tetratricopeptide (TPR) repeat protein